jgi:hypothetical protein
MHPYILMKQIVEGALSESGVQWPEVSEELRPDVFGSAFSVFDVGGDRIRLVWDGKDGLGFVQRWTMMSGGTCPLS